jgi:hypothetical protein
VYRNPNTINLGIFWKPTCIVVIPYSSNHPSKHNFAAFNYILNRTYRLPLNNEENYKELMVIKTIAKNSGYDMEDIAKVYKK